MRSTDPYAKDMPFKQRHEHTMGWNMPLTLAWIFHRVWFIDDEEYVTEDLHIDLDLIDKFLNQENMDPSTDVADEADVVVLNAFAAQIDSNAQEFMSPHQVACLTALILASCQDAPDRVSTLETARNELLLWQQKCEPAARIRKAKSAARNASEIAEQAADENIKAEYVEVINRIAAVAQKAAESAEKFRPFIEEDSGDAESRREAAQEFTEAVKLPEEAVKTAKELLEIGIAAKWKNYAAKRRFIKAERDFLGTHEA